MRKFAKIFKLHCLGPLSLGLRFKFVQLEAMRRGRGCHFISCVAVLQWDSLVARWHATTSDLQPFIIGDCTCDSYQHARLPMLPSSLVPTDFDDER
jgi:hypothetical protein